MTAAQARGCDSRKLCKDCRHIRRFFLDFGGYDSARCDLADSDVGGAHSLVSGRGHGFACIARMQGKPCGPEGKLWEARK